MGKAFSIVMLALFLAAFHKARDENAGKLKRLETGAGRDEDGSGMDLGSSDACKATLRHASWKTKDQALGSILPLWHHL